MSEISARIKTALLYTAESVERPHFEAEADAWVEQLRAEAATEERERLHAIADLSSEPASADAARLQGDPGLLRKALERISEHDAYDVADAQAMQDIADATLAADKGSPEAGDREEKNQ